MKKRDPNKALLETDDMHTPGVLDPPSGRIRH
jgi:hypothetical protein